MPKVWLVMKERLPVDTLRCFSQKEDAEAFAQNEAFHGAPYYHGPMLQALEVEEAAPKATRIYHHNISLLEETGAVLLESTSAETRYLREQEEVPVCEIANRDSHGGILRVRGWGTDENAVRDLMCEETDKLLQEASGD